jgi:predicted ArsR family transcriptional regulator
VIASALGERVAVTENGRRRHISKLEAAVKQLVNRAASGEARATQLLLALVQANEARPAQSGADRLGEADAIVMAELTRRLGSNAP